MCQITNVYKCKPKITFSIHRLYTYERHPYIIMQYTIVYWCVQSWTLNAKFYKSCSFLILSIYQTNHLLFLSIIITQYSDWTILFQLFYPLTETFSFFNQNHKVYICFIFFILAMSMSEITFIRILSSILANSLWKE